MGLGEGFVRGGVIGVSFRLSGISCQLSAISCRLSDVGRERGVGRWGLDGCRYVALGGYRTGSVVFGLAEICLDTAPVNTQESHDRRNDASRGSGCFT